MVVESFMFYDELVSSDSIMEVYKMKKKTNWEQLNFDQRKIISTQLSKKKKCKEIAELLNVDPSTISKEIKRNRTLLNNGKLNPKIQCKTPVRYPYVCNGCSKRYESCDLQRFSYIANDAQKLATYRLVSSRRGINLTPQELENLDRIVKEGVSNNESIYHIVKNNPDIETSVSTVYRYIDDGYLTTRPLDLPRKVIMKKRRVQKDKKKYDYSSNPIDRNNRTYLDYLRFKNQSPGLYSVQMDFLGKIVSDSKSILTLTIPELHFVMLFLLEKENAANVHEVFNRLETALGIEDFILVFPAILTDRDNCFTNYLEIECALFTGERRTHLFYCDAFRSTQKANVENMNQQLRVYFPKKESKENLTHEDMILTMDRINRRRINSLSGCTPIEAFTKVYGESVLEKLMSCF